MNNFSNNMLPSKSLEHFDGMFNQANTKHLHVVERMICDINRRMLREKTISFLQGNPKTSPKKSNLSKTLTPMRRSSYLGEFYERLEQDLEKRRVKSRIRQQIKKIMDKRKGEEVYLRKKHFRPHLPHRFAPEEAELQKLYGKPGQPIGYSDESWVTSLYDFK
jgi:ATP-dependent Lon protease